MPLLEKHEKGNGNFLTLSIDGLLLYLKDFFMIVQRIQASYASELFRPALRAEKKEPLVKDLPDNESKKETAKPKTAQDIAAIKARVKGGHYNSEAVLDDLSHSFAKMFDALL